MATLRALPFATVDSAITTTVESLEPGPSRMDDRTWDLFSETAMDPVFRITTAIDRESLATAVPEGLAGLDATRLVLVLESDSSRLRRIAFTGPATDTVVQVRLDRRELAGHARLRASVIRSDPGPVAPGFAHRSASVLASHEVASLWIDPPPVNNGRGIETRWKDFTEDADLPDGNLFAVRVEEAPVILLNSAIPNAYQILSSRGTHGASARIRDAVFSQIVHQVWTSLIGQCILSVGLSGDEEPDAALENVAAWEAQVIRDWAPEFFPLEQDPVDAVARFIDACRRPDTMLLLLRTADAIQSRMDTLRGFRGLVKESNRFDAGEGPQ